jgi:ferredoxin
LPAKQRAVIGLAVIDKDRCLPWADGVECLVCEELCPIPEKAIVFENGEGAASGTVDGTDPAGQADLKLPLVLEDHCTGCGICQYNCPIQGPAAIVIRPLPQTTTTTG